MITTYQIRNVLRVYGNQLKRKSEQLVKDNVTPYYPIDFVNISVDARQKGILSHVSNQIMSDIKTENKPAKAQTEPLVSGLPVTTESPA